MKLLLENWRIFLNEGPDAAFHGFKMKPTQMRVSPQCDTIPNDNQWEAGEAGCPQFTNDRGIGAEHEDIIEAIEFLENIKPQHLIAYSRGGAIALAALRESGHSPEITFVAPAWKRGWVDGIENPTFSNGVIIHGTHDDFVPLWHSAELSLKTGMPLYVFKGLGHVNILKHKGNPQKGREFTQKQIRYINSTEEIQARLIPIFKLVQNFVNSSEEVDIDTETDDLNFIRDEIEKEKPDVQKIIKYMKNIYDFRHQHYWELTIKPLQNKILQRLYQFALHMIEVEK